jgi:dihydroorotate dehydrogenase
MQLTFKGQPVEFGFVSNGSGALGFFGDDHRPSPDPSAPEDGEPYWYSAWYNALTTGVDRRSFTFTSKTATLAPRLSPETKRGNLRLAPDGIRVAERFPDCIRLWPFKKAGLNAVGLSNPGLQALLETGRWQQRRHPFKLSFMPEGATPAERADALEEALRLLAFHLPSFKAPFALEMNPLCPNATHEQMDVLAETIVWAAVTHRLGIPVLVKLNLTVRPFLLDAYMKTSHVDGIVMGNALNWHAAEELLDRKRWFGTNTSPLERYGGGAISGEPLFAPLLAYLLELAQRGVYRKTLITSGGINDVEKMRRVAATGVVSGIELATAFATHPWRVQDIIDKANSLFAHQENL